MSEKDLARNLKTARQLKGLTQETAANALGTSQSSLARYENGLVDVSTSTLFNASRLYEVSLDDLFSDSANFSGAAQKAKKHFEKHSQKEE